METMMRILKLSILLAALLGAVGPATAQYGGCLGACGTVASAAPTYQGPGDVVSGFLAWGSAARTYSSSVTAGSRMADLVQGPTGASPGAAVGTFRSASSGF